MSYRYLAAAGAALLLTAAAGAASAKPASAFLKDAIQGDNSEVELGRMAQNRAADPCVRDFGRMLEQDHSRARDQAVQVARQMGVHPPETMMPEARQERRRLMRMRGPAFDREFVRYMIQDHRKDIREFERQAAGRGPDARLARQTLPDLRKHLDTAQRIRG